MSNASLFHKSAKGRALITAAIIIAAVGLIVFGVYSGEAKEVFQKAVNICLECIGVG
ncbi:MAG: CD1871A family CXXC motif-containing protein [Christensenellales bacterium]